MLLYQDELEFETFQQKCEDHVPVAIHYVNKVFGRITRMMNGDELGSMIDSEYENLEIDDAFERHRHQMEVPSTISI